MPAADTHAPAFVEIGAVAREIGVSPSTLRSWERRYGLVNPRRGTHGQRLYGPDEVRLLREIQTQIRLGARAAAAHDRSSRASLHAELPPTTEAPRLARHAVDAVLGPTAEGEIAFFTRLVAAELVSNALLHGKPGESIVLEIDIEAGVRRIRVHNTGRPMTLKLLRTRDPAAGRGFEIIDALASWWSIESGPLGTTVTVVLADEDRGLNES
jgi:transposase-like protein/anti-sigma regulatory factor (Ser/Thr protein kinase)